MKGVVFTEFMEMVEDTFSLAVAEEILETADLPSGGAYTSVGNYEHEEMLSLVTELARRTEVPITDLLHAFGHHLFQTFTQMHPEFFTEVKDAYGLLEMVDDHIHVEVRKLYPDAKLPSFQVERIAQDDATGENRVGVIMHYSSPRPFAELAHGLIEATLKHWAHDGASILASNHTEGTINRMTFTVSEPGAVK